MREIKFRAWDKKHKRMWHFNEMCFAGACLGFEEADEKMLTPTEFERSDPSWDDIEVMQFTGLTDRNGVEIYEGDILRITSIGMDGEEDVNYRLAPPLTDYQFYCMLGSDPLEYQEIVEVIGNIHQHPDKYPYLHLLEANDER